MTQLEQLKNKWLIENVKLPLLASEEELIFFQSKNKILLPVDLMNYFQLLNGTGEEYEGNLFQFYSISKVSNINNEYKEWEGIPNYKNIVNTLMESEKYYVFANYSFHLFSYAIKLYPKNSIKNEVLVICGEEYKKIADSFSEFIQLYLDESIELQLNKEGGII